MPRFHAAGRRRARIFGVQPPLRVAHAGLVAVFFWASASGHTQAQGFKNVLPPEGSSVPIQNEGTSPGTPSSAPSPARPALSTSAIYAGARDSVVLIKTESATGAGFFVANRRQIATAYHVVSEAKSLTIQLRSGAELKARLTRYNEDQDLALLELERPADDIQPLPLRLAQDFVIGEPVVVIGHPFASMTRDDDDLKGLLTWTVTAGVLGAVGEDVLQTDAAINPGNSGGPVLDAQGKVVGVVSAQLRNANNVGFAVKIDRLQTLIEAPESDTPKEAASVTRGGMRGTLTSTQEGLWTYEFSIAGESRPSKKNAGLRTGVSLNYAWIDEMPDSGQLFNFHEEVLSAQLDFGFSLGFIPLDLVAGVSAGWRWRETILAHGVLDSSCATWEECPVTVTFEKRPENGPHLGGLLGIKWVKLLDGVDVGAGVRFEPFDQPLIQARVWVELLKD